MDVNSKSTHDADRLLIGTFTANGIVSLSIYDKNANKVARLGEFKSSQSVPFLRSSVLSNDKMIIMLPGENSEEVFFADLNTTGSLTQVTDNTVDEQVRWSASLN